MWQKLKKDPLGLISISIIVIVLMLGIAAPWVAPNDPNAVNAGLKYAHASLAYPFGNDHLGRCIFSRLLYGIRPSIIFVMLSMLGTIIIGLGVGVLAGYFRGKVDECLMRFCDILLSFPSEVMVLASIGIFGRGMTTILVTMTLLRWTWYARVFRTSVMKYTDNAYIQFAKATGCKCGKIICCHVLPSVLPDVSVIASTNICSMILSVSAFSFLGLGIEAPNAEWGMMLSEAKCVMLLHPLQIVPPAAAIVIVCIAFSFIGDSLRDTMDSKHISQKSVKQLLKKRGEKGDV